MVPHFKDLGKSKAPSALFKAKVIQRMGHGPQITKKKTPTQKQKQGQKERKTHNK